MGDADNPWPIRSAGRTRVLLICPQCGHEATESAGKLLAMKFYSCREDGCDYRFELVAAPRKDYGKDFIEVCKKFYAAFHAMNWLRSGQRLR